MERYLFCLVAVALIDLGICTVIWPAKVILQSRDRGKESRPPTAGEIWTTRIVGLALVAGGGYGLYALLTGLPGAEFSPA
jgi:hypothetical protein